MQEAIDSAIQQTYQNIEIIVINDGSNDKGRTDRIALAYGKQIKYYTKENGGVATALNLGIEHMNGEYFSWLSHDDVYYPKKVQEQIEYLNTQDNNSIILYSDFDIIDSKSKIIKHCLLDHDMLVKKPLYGILGRHIHGCSLLIPKEAFEKVGVFNVSLPFTQDYDLWLRLSKHYIFVHMKKTLIQSRNHLEQDSKIHSQTPIEGNLFWVNCITQLSEKEILACEETKTIFYLNMAKRLKSTPYQEAYDMSKKLAYESSNFLAFFSLQLFLLKFNFKKILRFIINKFRVYFIKKV